VVAVVERRERQRCASCSFVLYRNPASASAAVVLDTARQVLLIQRSIPPFEGSWAFPAGYQEEDEGPAEAALREVREEAGVEARVLGLVDLLFLPDDPRKPANVAVFLCSHVSGEVRAGDDARDARWFPLDALPEDMGFPNNRKILQRLLDPEGYPDLPLFGRSLRDALEDPLRPPTSP
jgi:8-oxo-dGTP diphosphatase